MSPRPSEVRSRPDAQAKSDLTELVACRSVADIKQQPKEQCEMAADWIVRAFTERAA